MIRDPVKRAYHRHKGVAKFRGIGFELSFDEWLSIWKKSRRWSRRGNRLGQFVMARIGDQGPYAVGNVKIISFSNNIREAKIGKPRPDVSLRNKTRAGQLI